MSLYLDTSALLKLSIEEPESEACEALLASDADEITASQHPLAGPPVVAQSGCRCA